MELEDCDDALQNFTGGTLELNPDDGKTPTSEHSFLISKTENQNESPSKRGWGNNIVSIPQRNKVWPKRRESNQNNSIKPAILTLLDGNANNFFTFRQNIIEDAVKDCVEFFLVDNNETLKSSFLLTEISLWDTEKERLILLSSKNVVVIKYDFIALRRLEHKIIPLENIDTVLIGDLVYPTSSIVPRINGFVDGLSTVVQNCLFDAWTKNKPSNDVTNYFHSSNRNMQGIRIMWNKGKPLNFGNKWNPLCNDVPFITFTSHPLLFHKECTSDDKRKVYNLDEFSENLFSALNHIGGSFIIQHKDIMMENYIGIGSLIHNRNGLGFFKVRGRFSF
ncbi:hypothetical protein FQR65_LT07462 [Abscondita terminalis]|nr:hypothetical protein FQR65_LT07462 [Abscondita terminalis]